jgi:hypothetical protein
MTTEMFQTAARGWHDFYLLTGGASATLTGLMFVAITFGAGLVSQETAASPRAFIDPTFGHFVQVLGTACLFVMPTMTAPVAGGLLVVFMGVRLVMLVWVFRHLRLAHREHGDLELSDWMISIVLPGLVFVSIGAAAGGFFLGISEVAAFNVIAGGTTVMLGIGVRSAWELMIWMAFMVAKKKEM